MGPCGGRLKGLPLHGPGGTAEGPAFTGRESRSLQPSPVPSLEGRPFSRPPAQPGRTFVSGPRSHLYGSGEYHPPAGYADGTEDGTQLRSSSGFSDRVAPPRASGSILSGPRAAGVGDGVMCRTADVPREFPCAGSRAAQIIAQAVALQRA